jgi:hypothetical protein
LDSGLGFEGSTETKERGTCWFLFFSPDCVQIRRPAVPI